MRPVLLGVGRVDHEDVGILIKAVEICVVHRAAGRVGNQRVLRLLHVQRGNVAREHML
ncbi:hypothetical protein SDC9_106591 [bioreactor metagenome]|uniref:Uncharacterized protein n=1 Tax=bioreactor metagenome TaxID=1076179 RepID=A0A645B2V5_9ZZZZ